MDGETQVTMPVPFNLSEDFRPVVVPEYQPPEPFHAQPAPQRKPKGFLNKEQREWKEIHERNRREVQVGVVGGKPDGSSERRSGRPGLSLALPPAAAPAAAPLTNRMGCVAVGIRVNRRSIRTQRRASSS